MMNVAVCLISCVVLQIQWNTAVGRAIEERSSFSLEEEELTLNEEACIDELHLDRQIISELNDRDITPEDDDDFNKFLDCYWQKENWIDPNGDMKYDNLLHSLIEMAEDELDDEDPELMSTIIKQIKESVAHCEDHPPPRGVNNGQTAARIQNCVLGKMNEMVGNIFSSSEEDGSDLSSKEEECADELELDKQFIIKLNDREIVPEDNNKYNAFLACYWQKEEWMDAGGDINFDNLLFSLRAMAAIAYQGEPREFKSAVKRRISHAIEHCQQNSSKGESHGQTAAILQNCIIEKLHKKLYVY